MIPNPGARARAISALVVTLAVVGCADIATPCPTELTTYVEGGGGSTFGDRATDVRGGVALTWDLTGAACYDVAP